MTGFAIRTGTPKAVSDRIERELLPVAKLPEVRERLIQLEYESRTEDSATFAKRIDAEASRLRRCLTMATRTWIDTAIQICDFTAFSELP